MRKIVDYGVIPISQVESGLRRGYEPLGRAFIGLNEEGLLQTVVKYDDPKPTGEFLNLLEKQFDATVLSLELLRVSSVTPQLVDFALRVVAEYHAALSKTVQTMEETPCEK